MTITIQEVNDVFSTLDLVGEFYSTLLEDNPDIALQFKTGDVQRSIGIKWQGKQTSFVPLAFLNEIYPVLQRVNDINAQYKIDPHYIAEIANLEIDDVHPSEWKDSTPDNIKREYESLWLSIYHVTPKSVRDILHINKA